MVMKAVSSEGTGQWEMGALQRNTGAIFKRIKGDKRLNWQRWISVFLILRDAMKKIKVMSVFLILGTVESYYFTIHLPPSKREQQNETSLF